MMLIHDIERGSVCCRVTRDVDVRPADVEEGFLMDVGLLELVPTVNHNRTLHTLRQRKKRVLYLG